MEYWCHNLIEMKFSWFTVPPRAYVKTLENNVSQLCLTTEYPPSQEPSELYFTVTNSEFSLWKLFNIPLCLFSIN